jgi:hypothetical protein
MSITPTNTKLTFDTDEGRINSYPSVVNANGQRIVFYEKFFTSGRTTGGRVTASLPTFTVTVNSGTGTLNGTNVSWSNTDITASPDKFEIVYVTLAGSIGISDDFSMTLMKDRIILAYIQSGASSIVRVIEIEKDGRYIYNRRQIQSGSNWIWDDNEYPLCTGETPVAVYNNGKIYLTYNKDDISYIRIFNPSDALTWSFLRPIDILSDQITLNNDPNAQSEYSFGCGKGCFTQTMNLQLFSMVGIAMTFIRSYSNPRVFKPVISSDYMNYVVGDFTIEFYTKSGNTYTLERSFTISQHDNTTYENKWFEWVDTPGQKYVVVACKISFVSDIIRTPYDAYPINIYANRVTVENPSSTSILAYVYEDMLYYSFGCSSRSPIIKETEFVESRKFNEDNAYYAFGCGQLSSVIKETEFVESRKFNEDNADYSFGCGSRSFCNVTTA